MIEIISAGLGGVALLAAIIASSKAGNARSVAEEEVRNIKRYVDPEYLQARIDARAMDIRRDLDKKEIVRTNTLNSWSEKIDARINEFTKCKKKKSKVKVDIKSTPKSKLKGKKQGKPTPKSIMKAANVKKNKRKVGRPKKRKTRSYTKRKYNRR